MTVADGPRPVEKVAEALYNATKQRDAMTWRQLRRSEAEEGSTHLIDQWYAVAVAAMDLANGARRRMS